MNLDRASYAASIRQPHTRRHCDRMAGRQNPQVIQEFCSSPLARPEQKTEQRFQPLRTSMLSMQCPFASLGDSEVRDALTFSRSGSPTRQAIATKERYKRGARRIRRPSSSYSSASYAPIVWKYGEGFESVCTSSVFKPPLMALLADTTNSGFSYFMIFTSFLF